MEILLKKGILGLIEGENQEKSKALKKFIYILSYVNYFYQLCFKLNYYNFYSIIF